MKFTLEIDMDNAAFEGQNGAESARILDTLTKRLSEYNLETGDTFPLRDLNGNSVGRAVVYED